MKPHNPADPLGSVLLLKVVAWVLYVLAVFPVIALAMAWWQRETTPVIVDGISDFQQPMIWIASAYLGASVTLVMFGAVLMGLGHLVEIQWALYTIKMTPK